MACSRNFSNSLHNEFQRLVNRWITEFPTETQQAILEKATKFGDLRGNDSKRLRSIADEWYSIADLPADQIDRFCHQTQRELFDWRWNQLKCALSRHRNISCLSDEEAERLLHEFAEHAFGRDNNRAVRDVVDDAFEIILNAIHGFDQTRDFNPWAKSVLRNKLRTRLRESQRRREVAYEDERHEYANVLPVQNRTESSGISDSNWIENAFSEILEGNFYPRTPQEPDQFAVLIIQIRIRMTIMFLRQVQTMGICLNAIEEVESRLVWPSWVRIRRILPNWPTLGEIWDAIKADLDPMNDRRKFIQCLLEKFPEIECTADQWGQWLKRGKAKLLQEFELSTSTQDFLNRIFPQRDR
ncbi:MAG: hypothetical protein N2112_13770 [Gemmataceae bacterium]|jgi:RNA polymerase sigma factor (sigma-70 family)|nr:hypothetical protein [Gemmataceae bacterium]